MLSVHFIDKNDKISSRCNHSAPEEPSFQNAKSLTNLVEILAAWQCWYRGVDWLCLVDHEPFLVVFCASIPIPFTRKYTNCEARRRCDSNTCHLDIISEGKICISLRKESENKEDYNEQMEAINQWNALECRRPTNVRRKCERGARMGSNLHQRTPRRVLFMGECLSRGLCIRSRSLMKKLMGESKASRQV